MFFFSMIDSEILFWSLQQFLDFLLRDLSGVLSFCQSVHNLTFHLVFFVLKDTLFDLLGFFLTVPYVNFTLE